MLLTFKYEQKLKKIIDTLFSYVHLLRASTFTFVTVTTVSVSFDDQNFPDTSMFKGLWGLVQTFKGSLSEPRHVLAGCWT